jgi:uncharacterized membrane protein YkvA (DUF1232 family)
MIVTIQLESALSGNPKTLGTVITPDNINEENVKNVLCELFREYVHYTPFSKELFVEWLAVKGWKTVKEKTLVVTLYE